MSANVNGRFEYETRFRKIPSPVVDRGSKKRSFECLLRVKGTSWKWPQIICKVVTGDETWCYGYDPETKQASSQYKTPNSPKPQKARQVRSNVKIILISFLDANGIVHKEFVPPGQTVNQQVFAAVEKITR